MHLADEACGRARRLAGMEQRALGALERRLGLERRVQRLDHALRAQEAALGDARDADALVRQLAAGEVDARDLEQRDPPRARVDVALARPRRGSGSASSAARSARPRSARAASTSCRRRAGALGVYVSAKPRPTSASSTRRRSACSRVSRPNISRRAGQRVRHVLEPEARDLLDHVDLARDVARAPGRDDDVRRRRGRSRAGRAVRTGARAASRRRSARRPARAGSGSTGARGQLGVHVGVRRPASARELEHQPRREVGRRPGEVRVDALLPAVRALGAQALALGRAVDAVRLEVRRLEQDGRRRRRRSRSPRRP